MCDSEFKRLDWGSPAGGSAGMGTAMGAAENGGDSAPPEVRARLKLFGGFKLSQPNGEAIPLGGKRERVLLAFLALSPNCRQPRRKLATLLWGDADDQLLLDNLRTCVWGVRKALNDTDHRIVVSDDDCILLNARAFEVDAWTFRQLSGQADRVALENAANLYSGEFLDGLTIESEEFQSWVRDEAGWFRDSAIDVLDRLAAQLADAGEIERAVGVGQRILRLDPLHERAARSLMRLYADTGRRGAVFQLYRSLSETLKGELNAEPEAETRRLFDEISRGGNASPHGISQTADRSPAANGLANGLSSIEAPDAAVTPIPVMPGPATPREGWLLSLRTGIAGAVILAAAAALGAFYLPLSGTPEIAEVPKLAFALPEKPSIAVLPFENLSGDKAQDDLADALTNDITTALSIISEMFVIDRGSTLAFRGAPTRGTQVAEDLGVRYVLQGSVQRSADRVRVSARLIDTLSGRQIWADLYDREIKDTFAVQDEITLAILTALQVHLTEGEQQRIMLVHGTRNLQAWIIAGQGLRALRGLTPEDNARARELYRQAVELDPNYPGALDGLAWSYLLAARFGWSDMPATDLVTAAGLGQKLVALDPLYSRTYALLGVIRLMMNQQSEAVSYGEKAVALDPNGSEVAALLALTLTYTDDLERSPDLMTRAMRLSPYYPVWYRWSLGRSYRLLGRYEEAEAALKSGPNTGLLTAPHLVELTATYMEQGKEAEARATAKEILALAPKFSVLAWTEHPQHQNAMVNKRERDILRQAGLPD